VLERKALAPEQAERRREVDARNAAIQAGKLRPPKSGTWGKPRDERDAEAPAA
jgi:hypothetical protein